MKIEFKDKKLFKIINEIKLDKKDILYLEIFNHIENSKKLNSEKRDKTCLVEFKDFESVISSLNKKIKDFFSNIITYDAQYNKVNNTVTLGKNLFKNLEKDVVFLHDLAKSLSNHQDFFHIIASHELGHALDHLDNSRNSKIHQIFKPWSKTERLDIMVENDKDVSELLCSYKSMINENFADLYSCFFIDDFYKEDKSKVLVEKLKQARISYKRKSSDNYAYYSTHNAIEIFQDEIVNKKIKSYEEMNSYIIKTTEKVVLERLNTDIVELTQKSSKSLSNLLGEINENYKFKSKDAKELIYKLKDENILTGETINFLEASAQDGKSKIIDIYDNYYNKAIFNYAQSMARKKSEEIKSNKKTSKTVNKM